MTWSGKDSRESMQRYWVEVDANMQRFNEGQKVSYYYPEYSTDGSYTVESAEIQVEIRNCADMAAHDQMFTRVPGCITWRSDEAKAGTDPQGRDDDR